MRARGVSLAIAFMLALGSGGCSSSYRPPVHNDPQHALATLYLRAPLARGFDLDANVELPRVAFDRGWYAIWFTYTRKPTASAPYPPYVQSGLIRLPQHHFALQPFVARSVRGGSPALQLMPALGGGAHRIALAFHAGALVYSVDGKQAYRVARASAFGPQFAAEYLQLGYELTASGDTAIGTMRDIRFSYGSQTHLRAVDPATIPCWFASNGVAWLPDAERLRARGRFDEAVPDGGNCPP